MRIHDRKGIEEIWGVFETAFKNQNKEKTAAAKVTPKKEPMKFAADKPWWEQLAGKANGGKGCIAIRLNVEDYHVNNNRELSKK